MSIGLRVQCANYSFIWSCIALLVFHYLWRSFLLTGERVSVQESVGGNPNVGQVGPFLQGRSVNGGSVRHRSEYSGYVDGELLPAMPSSAIC